MLRSKRSPCNEKPVYRNKVAPAWRQRERPGETSCSQRTNPDTHDPLDPIRPVPEQGAAESVSTSQQIHRLLVAPEPLSRKGGITINGADNLPGVNPAQGSQNSLPGCVDSLGPSLFSLCFDEPLPKHTLPDSNNATEASTEWVPQIFSGAREPQPCGPQVEKCEITRQKSSEPRPGDFSTAVRLTIMEKETPRGDAAPQRDQDEP
ncbi:hypothetical protein MJG53_018993 [Ovis ammon polii x Ovis aries]|uniref:Uncharacterized protein n=1 Tax=Ovis ammon polii x Ovis aries TaxID=2918886 RepID=A0ACB9U3V7_9CETA|nr:hypothetical protein MJG53_018993 [Ovis ammon polii x Ovis aries]